MTDQAIPNRDFWDGFLDLLYPSDESMTIAEIDECLERAGIDVDAGLGRFTELVEKRRARVRLSQAKQQRASFGQKVSGITAPGIENLRDTVRGLIQSSGGEDQKLAYFHKLEEAASDNDLRSLMDDLEKLKALGEQSDEA